MTALAIVAATWLTPFALIGLWIAADRWLDSRHAAETETLEPSAEWRAVLRAVEDPPFAAHPAAGRIVDLIARNEAKRIDDEWLTFAEEWRA